MHVCVCVVVEPLRENVCVGGVRPGVSDRKPFVVSCYI